MLYTKVTIYQSSVTWRQFTRLYVVNVDNYIGLPKGNAQPKMVNTQAGIEPRPHWKITKRLVR